MLFRFQEHLRMLNFDKFIFEGIKKSEEKNVKAKATAEIASETFTSADPDDQAAGSSYFADGTAY
jgi:hypothetical protein